METPRAPALGFCLVFLASAALARAAIGVPVWAGALLCLLGVALGARPGRATAALGCGWLAVAIAPPPLPPSLAPLPPATVAGRVCSHELRFGQGSAVEVCADRIRRGREVELGRWEVRFDLPEGSAAPPLGARVRAVGRLGRPAGFDNRFRAPAGRLSLRIKSPRFVRIEAPPPWPLAWASRARAALDRAWRRQGEGRPGAALARAMVLGDVSELSPRWVRALRRTGLAHLTAVSGFNIALVAGWAALAGALLPRPLRVALSALVACAYLGLVGPAPSVLRAAAMTSIAALALLSARAPSGLQGLALTAVALVARDPTTLADPGFLLSATATAGLLAGTPRIEARLGLRPRLVARAVAASLAAQAAAAPVAVALFGRLTLAAPLLNLVFAPWAALVLVTGLVAGALATAGLDRWAAPWLGSLDLASGALEALSRLPPSLWVSAAITPGWVAGVAAGALFLLPAIGRRGLRGGLLASVAVAASLPPPVGAPSIELATFDVGQGDAILVRGGEGVALVDGGGTRGRDLAVQVLLPALAARGVDRLDLVVLSHFDDDHCKGLVELADYVRFAEIWLPRGAVPSRCSSELAATPGALVRTVAAGERRALGTLRFEVLHPEAGVRPGSDNALSLVLRVSAAGRSALLLGDLDGPGERRLALRLGTALRADLLKVAHHGSATSTTPELLAAARPRLAIVSAGPRNPYGHPSPRVLGRLSVAGVRWLRTDRDGGVEVTWGRDRPWRIELPGSPRRIDAGGG